MYTIEVVALWLFQELVQDKLLSSSKCYYSCDFFFASACQKRYDIEYLLIYEVSVLWMHDQPSAVQFSLRLRFAFG